MERKQRVIYFDILRVTAIFLMMVLHIASGYLNSAEIGSRNWNIANIYESAVRCCVPLFLMISGRFFLDPDRECSFHRIITRNVKKLAIAFLFWSALYALYACYVDADHSMVHLCKNFIQQFICGHYHMWFLFALAVIYLCVPILRKITVDKKLTGQMLLIVFIFAYVLPFIEENVPGIGGLVATINGNIGFGLLGSHMFYFVLGYYLGTVDLSKKWYWFSYLFGSLATLYIIVGTYRLSNASGVLVQNLYGYATLCVVLQSVAVFLAFRMCLEKRTVSPRTCKGITILSSASFGMYLVHDFFNCIFINLGGLSWKVSYIWVIPVASISVFVGSFLVIEILRRIPGLGKIII